MAAAAAWWRMDSLSNARTDTHAYRLAARQPQTWVVSILYIGTFGSFIGYSFAMPLVIKNTFPDFLAKHPFIATYLAGLAFLGALVGSLTRPVGGWLADRVGGARITLASFAGMAVMTAVAIAAVQARSFTGFLLAFTAIFALAGLGNGSTYRMIPSIFAALARDHADDTGLELAQAKLLFKRQAASVIGIAGAIGALGGFLIQVALRQASLGVADLVLAAKTPAAKLAVAKAHADWALGALWVFLAAYILLGAITWFFYMRKSIATRRIPSLAHASV
jgi:NNP family nitrate/nitrite transporter-like MFS transporter